MSEVYRIGIAILLADNTAAGMSRISHRLMGIHATTGQINANFGRWATLIGGTAAVMGGVGILKGLRGIAQHGKELLDQQDKLIRAGRTQTEVANLTAEAYGRITKAVPTATGADVLRVANELTLVKGSFKEAAEAATMSLKLEALVGNATGRKAEGEGYNVWRALELKNVTLDHALTDKLMGGMVQAMIASGGKVTGLDWLTTARQGGVAWTNIADKFLTGTLPTVIQELGGMRTGTSLMTSYQTLLGATTLRKQQYELFSKIGMIDESKVTHDKGGRVNLGVGAIKGSTLGMQDPYEWTQTILKPALEAAGYKTIQQQREAMAKLFPNRNANRMFDIFLDPASVARIEKDRTLYSQAKGLNPAYQDFISKNPKGVEAAFHAQYESMMGAIGAPLMQSAMPVMRTITDMFNKIGEFANEHPTAIQYIGQGFAALGIALTVAGGAAILAALGPVGWIAGGLVLLGAALMAVPWKEVWDGLGSAIDAAGKIIVATLNAVTGALPKGGIASSPLGGAAMGAATGAMLGGAPGAIAGATIGAGIPVADQMSKTPSGRAVLGSMPFVGQPLLGYFQFRDWLTGSSPTAAAPAPIMREAAPPIDMSAPGSSPTGPKIELPSAGRAHDGVGAQPMSWSPVAPQEQGSVAPRQSWNAIPPARAPEMRAVVASVNLDGRKVGEATLKYIVDEGRGAPQGSAYFDGTFGSTPTDLAMA